MLDEQWMCFSYSLLIFFKSSLHYIHLVYYVQIFVSVYRIDAWSFWLAQSIFLVWNTFNDPFFGWLSDRYLLSLSHRLTFLSVCAPLFSLSSLLFWFPWTDKHLSLLGVQLTISLCLYDTFLTALDLNCSALLVVIADHQRERLSSASTIGHALGEKCEMTVATWKLHFAAGSISLFVSYALWSPSNLRSFRVFVTFFTLCATLGSICLVERMKQNLSGLQIRWDLSESFFAIRTLSSRVDQVRNIFPRRAVLAFGSFSIKFFDRRIVSSSAWSISSKYVFQPKHRFLCVLINSWKSLFPSHVSKWVSWKSLFFPVWSDKSNGTWQVAFP